MEEETLTKKRRAGVGSSVVELVRKPGDDFTLLLAKVRVERLRPKATGEVVTVYRKDSLQTLSAKFVDHNILGVAVLNQNEKFYGFVEQRDLVAFVINHMFQTSRFADDVPFSTVDSLMSSAEYYRMARVSTIMHYPFRIRGPNHIVSAGSSLLQAWEVLARDDSHRIPVLDKENKVVDIITQSMLIDFMWQNIEKLGDFAQMTLAEIFEKKRMEAGANLISVGEEERAHVAFRTMISNNVSGLPVLNSQGALVGNISFRDFRGAHVDARSFWRLWSTVKDFLATTRAETTSVLPPVICALPTDSFYSLVEKMALRHIHRVYMVRDTTSMAPISVISQTDVLRAFLQVERGDPVE